MEGEMKEETLPPGFRFHPTDEELITFYLINKISDSSFTGRAIADVDLNKSEPWDLPGESYMDKQISDQQLNRILNYLTDLPEKRSSGKAKMGEKEWYFFSMRDRKYPTGVRTNRATNTGYWKTTGKDKEIYNSVTTELVGMKKTLVFYRGRAPRGEKTNWVMHEYRIHAKSSYRTPKDEWVVCRVFQKSVGGKKMPLNNSSRGAANMINHYNLDVGSSAVVSSHQMMQTADGFQFNMGRNYMMSPEEIQELSTVFRGSSSSSSSNIMNLPLLQSQMNYSVAEGVGGGGSGSSCFTISGLNLNLSGSTAAPPSVFRSTPLSHPTTINHHRDVVANSNPLFTNGVMSNPHDDGYITTEIHNPAAALGNRFGSMDHCDIDHYWPPY